MGLLEKNKKKINDRRRENKKRSDLLKKQTYKHEVSYIFQTYYRDQVAALYREVNRSI